MADKGRQGPREEGVILKTHEQVNEAVDHREDHQGLDLIGPALERPAGIEPDQQHGGHGGGGEGPVEADQLRDAQKQQVKDHLGQADQNVLGRVNAAPREGLEDKKGQEDQANEHDRVLQGAGDVLVRVVRLDEGDAGVLLRQSGRRKRAGNAMGGEAPGDERHVPDRAEGAGGSVACLRQKAAIEGRSAPVPAHFHMR